VYKINTTPAQKETTAGWMLTSVLPAPHDKDKDVEPPFSAEGYLRNATGPLAPKFRGLVPDVNGMARLDRDSTGLPSRLKASWKAELDRVSSHYAFTAEQMAAAEKLLADESARVDDWFLRPENSLKIRKYYRDLRHVLDVEQSPESLPYQRTLAYKQRLEVDRDRRDLVAEVDARTKTLRDSWIQIATPDQSKRAGTYKDSWTQIDWINLTTMWGLVLVGSCLMVGLFTPLAALGGVAYLSMFYLSMPPWPGLPVGKAAEGHYLFVNKNLIELIACLVLASTPSGMWLGLDALIFGRGARRRAAAAELASAESAPVVTSPPVPTAPPADSGRTGKNPRRI